jgi:hypothetical protein
MRQFLRTFLGVHECDSALVVRWDQYSGKASTIAKPTITSTEAVCCGRNALIFLIEVVVHVQTQLRIHDSAYISMKYGVRVRASVLLG